jgi:hypothetical protein
MLIVVTEIDYIRNSKIAIKHNEEGLGNHFILVLVIPLDRWLTHNKRQTQ